MKANSSCPHLEPVVIRINVQLCLLSFKCSGERQEDAFPSASPEWPGTGVLISLQKLLCETSPPPLVQTLQQPPPPPAVAHQSVLCVCVCFGKWGVSARVLLTPQGVKDSQTNSASLSDSLFHVTLLEPFDVFYKRSGRKEKDAEVDVIRTYVSKICRLHAQISFMHMQNLWDPLSRC